MSFCGLAGLSRYLILPLVASFADSASVPFWSALKYILASQRSVSRAFSVFATKTDMRDCCVTFVLPLIFIAIRWPVLFRDTSKLASL
jgi:hypothetical protein